MPSHRVASPAKQPDPRHVDKNESRPRFGSMPKGKPIRYRFGREASLPGLTNNLGSIQIEADPIAIKHPVFPPVSGGEETTGMTTLDGTLLVTTGKDVAATWSLASIARTFSHNRWTLRTTTAIVPGQAAVVIRVELTNASSSARNADLRIRLSGRSRNTGPYGYAWRVPTIAVASLNGFEGLDVVEKFDARNNAVRFHNIAEPCCSVQGAVGLPARFEASRLKLSPRVGARKTVAFHLLLVYGTDRASTLTLYKRLASRAAGLIAETEAYWHAQWSDARQRLREITVRPATALGQRPTRLSAAHRRLLDMSLATTLYLRRDTPSFSKESFYLTLFPRRGEGGYFLWDIGQSSPFVGAIDPESLRGMVHTIAYGMDIYSQQQLNAFTGIGRGWFYAANPWSLFRMVWSVLCATRDFAWLDAPLSGIRHGQTVFEMLEELSLCWTLCTPDQTPLTKRTRFNADSPHAPKSKEAAYPARLAMPDFAGLTPRQKAAYPFGVADVGSRGVLLEGTTNYQHQVASMNAGFVWMMRRVAELQVHRGNSSRATELTSLAKRLARQILALYRPADGFFSCGYPDGAVVPSRVSQDHLMVMVNMPEDLSPAIRAGLTRSFRRELQSNAWMRCVSPADPDVVSGCRSDVTFVGSYAGWVALMAEGLCNIGQRNLASEWLARIASICAQGPVAQSYWCESQAPATHGGPTKCTDEMPHGTHWAEAGGATFGSAIIHGLLAKPWTPFA